MSSKNIKYPGLPSVIHGNGAIAHVMNHVCGGVIGFPITPSTEISELFEATRAEGGVNVWGKHPFFFSPEGEHSAQSGAFGAALTGGQFVSNASSSQGVLYALESHYMTVGKKIGGFVLQVAARTVTRHSLNVMAGHDDIYALLPSGYTILFGANPQEAADFAAISYRCSALSLIPVANAIDGFSTSHMMSEAVLPEPELLAEYLGDPAGRIKAPTVAQEMLYGAQGRVYQLKQYLSRHKTDIATDAMKDLKEYLDKDADQAEKDNKGLLIEKTLNWIPEELHAQWRRQWLNAFEKGTRQLVPALVDVNNPGLVGAVQNQPDYQAGTIDHRTHFASAVPSLMRQAMDDYAALTGRQYSPVQTFMCDDAETVMVGLGSVTEDVEAVVSYLRSKGQKVGLVAIKLLQPFPEADVVAALKGKKAVTVLERSDELCLTNFVTQALFKARENADRVRYPDIPSITSVPQLTTAVFGLGGHDLQPRYLVAAFKNMVDGKGAPLIYLGSQLFSKNPSHTADIEARLRAAYPETELMALETEENPKLLPDDAFRIRFHSVGGYGTIASGKLLTDILAGVLDMHSKSAPKYGSEKSGASTNFYITLSPEPIKITNADLEDVEVVISPDHKVFSHANPLRGLVDGGTFIIQSNLKPEEIWRELPKHARKTIRDKKIHFFIVDAFSVAKRHAPIPELETRMMGIAFIGAVAGHVDRVSAGAPPDVILEKVRQQISKKFGGKGEVVVESNMAVIREGIEATQRIDYDTQDFLAIDAEPDQVAVRNVSLSAALCQNVGASSYNGLFNRDYYDDMVARPFREGTIGEAPVLPGTGLFMPTGTAGSKDKGLFRRAVPDFNPDVCTGCMECALVCPDAAIPNTVHDIHDLLLTAVDQMDLSVTQRDEMKKFVYPLTEAIRDAYRQNKDAPAFHEMVASAAAKVVASQPTLQRNFNSLASVLSTYPVARTRPFFDAFEKAGAVGGLYSVAVDPWKCTGCLECVEVCGPHALTARDQDADFTELLQERFEFMTKTPNTPARFSEDAIEPDGEAKRLMLDRTNYYATTGGHGACRGCGEVTAIRQMTATGQALATKRKNHHIHELEKLLDQLNAKRNSLASGDAVRMKRLDGVIDILEKRLYFYEGGPTGKGPSGMVVANSTGCSSVYSSTFPFNCYNTPWVNGLFQDAQPLAKGIFEGLLAKLLTDVRALRIAKLELDDQYDPAVHDEQLCYLTWDQFTEEERNLMPTVMTIGGDGASYDIGFGALSRILVSDTPIKMMVLNTGAYSNTGGQASTSSYIGQDADLARFGDAHKGKFESRKELALIASFHPNVFVCASCTSLQGHFLKNAMEFLSRTDSPALFDVYTPCQSENGIADNVSYQHARLAVECRMNPVFVHDPRRGTTLHEWFSLEGNPDPDKTWTTTSLEYLDDAGQLQLMDVVLTPANFALGEIRFKKQFRKLRPEEETQAVSVEVYVELPQSERDGKIPFIYSVDGKKRLVKLAVSQQVIHLVEERRHYWQTLQYLDGQHVEKMEASHRVSMDGLMVKYQELTKQRDISLDDFARSMSELAASSKAQPVHFSLSPMGQGGSVSQASTSAPVSAPSANGNGEAVVSLSPDDREQCTNCKTCYQDLPEIFEKTRLIVDGESREAAQMIPGVLDHITMTPELKNRVKRVAANCDAEIIHYQG